MSVLDCDCYSIRAGRSSGHDGTAVSANNPFVSPTWLFTFELLHTPLAEFLVEAQVSSQVSGLKQSRTH